MRTLILTALAASAWLARPALSLAAPAEPPARSAPAAYPFAAGTGDDLAARVAPPGGARRLPLPAGSFGDWLRHLPLLPPGTPVHLYTGAEKPRQDVHAHVVDLDVGTRDLQQCADAVMRLRAEYLFSSGQPERIRFHPDPGKPRVLAYTAGPDRRRFQRYLIGLFSDAGSASLQAELQRRAGPPEPGDVLIQGGYPGHAVLVLDAAERDGRRLLLLGQSYMPAQQFHVLKNLADPALSPWFDAATLAQAGGLRTPEWRPFTAADVRHFADPPAPPSPGGR